MKRILLPTDFSTSSRNAEDFAFSLAKVFRAEVKLLHVYREFMPATLGPEPWTVTASKRRIENERLMNREVEYLESRYSVHVEGDVESGPKSKTINAIAAASKTDIIVFGMHERKLGQKLGSTISSTIRKTKIPVLIVPEKAKFSMIKNIVIAADFTEMLDSDCFDIVYEIYKKFDSSIRVLHVESPGAQIKASEVPEKLQLGLALSRFSYEYEKAESYEVETAIRNFIDKHPTDLLVLIAHHHSIYERIFETIHTKDISLNTQLPLLVLRHQ